MYNIIFTAWAVPWFAVFDFEYPKEVLNNNPVLYKAGPRNKHFGKLKFWLWILYATLQALLLFYLVIYTFEMDYLSPNGKNGSLWTDGVIIFACVVIIVNIEVISASNLHYLAGAIIQLLSIVSFFMFYWIESALPAF